MEEAIPPPGWSRIALCPFARAASLPSPNPGRWVFQEQRVGLIVLETDSPRHKGLTSLEKLDLRGCTALQNVDGLKGLSRLQWLALRGCTVPQNVDGIKGLSGLQGPDLRSCTKLPPSSLRELHAALPKVEIEFPDGTSNPPP